MSRFSRFLSSGRVTRGVSYLLLSSFQVDLEPNGKLHIVIELCGSATEGRTSLPFLIIRLDPDLRFNVCF